jgi:hypothetical protein
VNLIMPKSKNFVHRASDRFVIFATEIGKGTVREVFRVGTQLADSCSAALIQIVSDNETYYAARRNRIHPGPEIIRRPRAKIRSGFADLYERDDDRDDSRSSDSFNAEGASALLVLSEPPSRQSVRGGGRDCEFSDTASFMTERPLHRRITRSALQSVRWGLARGRFGCPLPPTSRNHLPPMHIYLTGSASPPPLTPILLRPLPTPNPSYVSKSSPCAARAASAEAYAGLRPRARVPCRPRDADRSPHTMRSARASAHPPLRAPSRGRLAVRLLGIKINIDENQFNN